MVRTGAHPTIMYLHQLKQLWVANVLSAALLPSAQAAPSLDLSIQHYSRVMTAEGVLRESRYQETMLRRPGHVWLARVLPPASRAAHDTSATHHEPNYAVLPRHVMLEAGRIRLEAVDVEGRELIAIPPSEYENANFDGSWVNAFFLMDPRRVASLPLSTRASAVPGARWREQDKNGLFQRVLWDEQRMVPLVVETGDQAGTRFERITVTPLPGLRRSLPWAKTKSYAQKEFADFLD
jgi:hypothetical protein